MKLGSVLKQIIQDKKKLVEESKNKISLEELKNKTSEIIKPIDFKNIFNSNEISLIAEIKRSSASAGDILPELNLPDITNTYIKGGASAVTRFNNLQKIVGRNESNDYASSLRSLLAVSYTHLTLPTICSV